MAEEGTLGLARAYEEPTDDLSKEELQQRLNVARNSISHTVTEIKETVANQVQAVKETLDWREQVKKRPAVWAAGALGVGFVVGYGVAGAVKGDGDDNGIPPSEVYAAASRSHAARPVLNSARTGLQSQLEELGRGQEEDHGPGFLERVSTTAAYGRVRDEVGNIGDAFVKELSKTATQVILPAVITSIRNFLGGHLPASSDTAKSQSLHSAGMGNESPDASRNGSAYQPALEQNPT